MILFIIGLLGGTLMGLFLIKILMRNFNRDGYFLAILLGLVIGVDSIIYWSSYHF